MTLEKFVDTGAALPLDEKTRKALGIVSEPIRSRELAREIRSYGEFEADESTEQVVSAWIGGRIERMYADVTGVAVKRGWHLFDLYSPELYAAQKELLLARKSLNESPEGPIRKSRQRMVDLAREKLALLGLSPDQLESIESADEPQLTLRIDSPSSGIVLEKLGHPGMYVKQGQPIYRIADLSTLWLIVEVHESDLGWIALGQTVEVSVNALSGRSYQGRVGFIEPTLNRTTRSARIRVEVPNPDGELRLGMYATATIFAPMTSQAELAYPELSGAYACPMHPLQRSDDENATCDVCGMSLEAHTTHAAGKVGSVLALPKEAVISTGKRHLVYIETPRGTASSVDIAKPFLTGEASYSGFEVELGPLAYEWMMHEGGHRMRLGAYYPILKQQAANPEVSDMMILPGITRVVLNGQFLIDSQMELTGKPSLINPDGAEAVDPHAGHKKD